MTSGDTVMVDDAVKGLEALGTDLSSRGFMTTVMEGGGPPCVRVVSRAATQLSENVYAAPADDGSLWCQQILIHMRQRKKSSRTRELFTSTMMSLFCLTHRTSLRDQKTYWPSLATLSTRMRFFTTGESASSLTSFSRYVLFRQ